jgi:hypothetical protein
MIRDSIGECDPGRLQMMVLSYSYESIRRRFLSETMGAGQEHEKEITMPLAEILSQQLMQLFRRDSGIG